ncbi:LysR family transcriptional regulator [Cupriavidus basilensis]|uniref:LysR family transcriptional regulator n=1 Tax=Cupriavidus basilensis TaxID=68895 RepID=A0ABT6AH66_9BURK|nr:LysR family transcriptional regulator [Cupriavidus basilensis]MDF3831937.1 LysR family transcriptional regulator [Cupriavidus basilensis]
MNLHDLEAFLAVVETGSIVGAASRLHLTQPGITRRIQSLEELLGTVLLDRQSKPLRPTTAGRETYAHGRRVLRAIDDLRAGLSADAEVGGEFRLGITPYLSEIALAEPIDQLHREFPALVQRITTGWPAAMAEQCRRGEIDAAAFCLPEGTAPPDGLEAEDLGMQDILLVAARDLALPPAAALRDLAAYPWILNQDGCGFRSAIRQRLSAQRLPLRIGIEAHSTELRLSLVARGLGIGLATPSALAHSAWRDALRVVEAEDFTPRVTAWLVHHTPASRLSRPLARLGEALRAALQRA